MKRTTIFFSLLLMTVLCLGQTSRTVSGIITDKLGNPLRFVPVAVKGTNIQTASDVKGNYSLNVPENAVLLFSLLGCVAQEIAVENKQVINVVMLDDLGTEGIEPAKKLDLTLRQSERAEADNSLAFRMFREVSKLQGENTFFSPFSLSMALGMLYNGATGDIRTEMIKTLGIADFSETEINDYYKKISQELLVIDPTTKISIANSIWYRNTFQVKNTFIETCREYFDAEVQALDFGSNNVAQIINKWCADKTKNRISNIVANPVPDEMMMYLINALYFKSKWEKEKRFDEAKTKQDDFTKTNNQKIKVNMMEQTTSLRYYADRYMQCVELPYGNLAFSMVAILPPENMNINQLIEYLPGVRWPDVINRMGVERVWLKLPRFKTECEFSLNRPVKNLGMNRIFDPSYDFANISDELLNVSEIKQKTFVEVNEEGAEASAVTALSVVAFGEQKRGTPIEPVRFFADRPFLFLIREKSSGVILFIGRMDEPHE